MVLVKQKLSFDKASACYFNIFEKLLTTIGMFSSMISNISLLMELCQPSIFKTIDFNIFVFVIA